MKSTTFLLQALSMICSPAMAYEEVCGNLEISQQVGGETHYSLADQHSYNNRQVNYEILNGQAYSLNQFSTDACICVTGTSMSDGDWLYRIMIIDSSEEVDASRCATSEVRPAE